MEKFNSLNVVFLQSTIMPRHEIYPLSLPQSSVKSAQKYVVFCPFQTEEGSDQKGVSVRVPPSKAFFFWPFSIFPTSPSLIAYDCDVCLSFIVGRAVNNFSGQYFRHSCTFGVLCPSSSLFVFFSAEGTQLESNRRIGSEVE